MSNEEKVAFLLHLHERLQQAAAQLAKAAVSAQQPGADVAVAQQPTAGMAAAAAATAVGSDVPGLAGVAWQLPPGTAAAAAAAPAMVPMAAIGGLVPAASAENRGLFANTAPMALGGPAAAAAAAAAAPVVVFTASKPAPEARAAGGKRKAGGGRRSRQAESDTEEEEDWWVQGRWGFGGWDVHTMLVCRCGPALQNFSLIFSDACPAGSRSRLLPGGRAAGAGAAQRRPRQWMWIGNRFLQQQQRRQRQGRAAEAAAVRRAPVKQQ